MPSQPAGNTAARAIGRQSWRSSSGVRSRHAAAASHDASRRTKTRRAYDEHHAAMRAVYGRPEFAQPSSFALEAFRHAAALAQADSATPRSVLDIGSGVGITTLNFAKMLRPPAIAVGMDVSAPCVGREQERLVAAAPPGVRLGFVLADIVEASAAGLEACAGRPFDLLYANATLHHLPPADLRAVLIALSSPRCCHPTRGVFAASFIGFSADSVRGINRPRPDGGGVLRCLTGRLAALDAARVLCRGVGWEGVEPAEVIDAESAEDDGGGVGAAVVTGDEFIPGR